MTRDSFKKNRIALLGDKELSFERMLAEEKHAHLFYYGVVWCRKKWLVVVAVVILLEPLVITCGAIQILSSETWLGMMTELRPCSGRREL